MLGNRSGIYPVMSDDELREKIEPASSLFCVGHTHLPLIRRLDHTLVVNAGAVGLPFDGMPGSYVGAMAMVGGRLRLFGWIMTANRLSVIFLKPVL
jgi:hypothetical protein